MAYPQYIQMAQVGIHLQIEWINVPTPVSPPHALIIEVANDGELTTNSRRFLIPSATTSVLLDVGPGTWYVRIGACVGNEHGGVVEWSGVYGPCLLFCTTKDIVPSTPSSHVITSTQSILDGVRLFTEQSEDSIAMLEVVKTTQSLCATTTAAHTRYIIVKNGRNYVDCTGIAYPTEYTIRYTHISAFPTKPSITQLKDGMVVSKQTALRPAPRIDSTAQATHTADVTVMRDIEQVKHPRFASHADYVRYMASRARMT
jgi:hypothetical protein